MIDEPRFPGRQGRLLFAYLVAERGRAVPRDELAEALWGEAPPATWDKVLSVIVSKLRSLLAERGIDGGHALTGAFGCYRLDLPKGTWVDVIVATDAAHDAEAALAAGDLDKTKTAASLAASLLDQPFLPGEGGAWVEQKRREFADTRGRALSALAEACLRSGDAAEAVKWAEQTISLAPFRETGYRRLMDAHVAAGDRAEALRVYDQCRRLLAEELGAYPSPETESIYRGLLEAPIVSLSPVAPPVAAPEAPVYAAARGRRVVLVLGCAAAAIASVTTVGLVTHGFGIAGGPSGAPGGNVVAAVGASSGGHVSYTAVGTTPGNIVVGEGAVWVLNADDRTITRIDPASGRVVKTFAATGEPTDLAAGRGALWVGSAVGGKGLIENGAGNMTVSRVNPVSTEVTKTVHLPGAPMFAESGQTLGVSGLAVGAGGVWAVDPDGSISRISPATGSLAARVAVTGAKAIAAGDAGVWFLTSANNGPAVARVDPRTNQVAQVIPVETSDLVGIAVGAGSVWATDPYDGVVWRIVPGPQPVARTVSLGFGVTQVAFGDGAVWAANVANATISRIDPRTDEITSKHRLDGTPAGLAVGAGAAWASVAGGSTRAALSTASCSPVESGGARPDVLIASDLPLQGPSVAPTLAAAVRFVLRQHGFRAGRFTVGVQSCDDSTARTQGSDFFKCASNARDFGSNEKLVAVIGPYDSSCAEVEIPVTNRSPLGPVAVMSPANTSPSLTRSEPEGRAGEPGILYPTRIRNYMRLASPDDVEGAAGAELAKELAVRQVYVLSDGSVYGRELSRGFRTAAGHLGVAVSASEIWNPNARGYEQLLGKVVASKAQGVLLAGYGYGAGGLIRALRGRFGSRLTLIAGDGFLPIPETLKAAGPAARGMYVNISAVLDQSLTPPGRRLIAAFERTRHGDAVPSGTYLPETLEATELVVDAIARSDGTRASVLRELDAGRVSGGLFGGFHFDRNGDMTPAPFAIVRITGGRGDPGLAPELRGSVFDRTVRAPLSLLERDVNGPDGGRARHR